MGGASAESGATSLETAQRAIACGDLDGAVAHFAAAVRAFTAADDKRRAALACSQLGYLFEVAMANKVAARPWLTRAERLLADEEPCVEQGWVAVTAARMRELGDLAPTTLALMHGSSYRGDGGKALYDLAAAYERQYLSVSST